MLLRLPWPPSVNKVWRYTAGRAILSRRARRYREDVVAALASAGQWPAVAMPGRLSAAIEARPPDRRRRDLDNLLKAVLDALRHAGLYLDDAQLDRIAIVRAAPTAGGLLLVTLGPAVAPGPEGSA